MFLEFRSGKGSFESGLGSALIASGGRSLLGFGRRSLFGGRSAGLGRGGGHAGLAGSGLGGSLGAGPLLLLGDGAGTVADLANVFGWAFAIWGVGLYWWGGVLYAFQVRRLLTTSPRLAPEDRPTRRDRRPV